MRSTVSEPGLNGDNNTLKSLTTDLRVKGHCHEDFAVLGQFCAKIVTLRLKS